MQASTEHVLSLQNNDKPLVYTAMSKHLFYMREHISRFVLEQDAVPLNPFMLFNYFLGDTVDRDVVRQANNVVVAKCDELWQFGPVSDGALAEIVQARRDGKPVRYFRVENSKDITEITKKQVELEAEVKDGRELL